MSEWMEGFKAGVGLMLLLWGCAVLWRSYFAPEEQR
jgi:hypothetical protein